MRGCANGSSETKPRWADKRKRGCACGASSDSCGIQTSVRMVMLTEDAIDSDDTVADGGGEERDSGAQFAAHFYRGWCQQAGKKKSSKFVPFLRFAKIHSSRQTPSPYFLGWHSLSLIAALACLANSKPKAFRQTKPKRGPTRTDSPLKPARPDFAARISSSSKSAAANQQQQISSSKSGRRWNCVVRARQFSTLLGVVCLITTTITTITTNSHSHCFVAFFHITFHFDFRKHTSFFLFSFFFFLVAVGSQRYFGDDSHLHLRRIHAHFDLDHISKALTL